MSSRTLKAMLFVVLLGAVLGVTIQPAAGQDLKGFSRPRTVTRALSVRTIPAGEEITLTGNVIKFTGDTFSICDVKGAETLVSIMPETKITTHRRGTFRGAEKLDKDVLLIGLRVQAHGRGNEAGGLNARWVRTHDADNRAETQLDSRAIPIELEQIRQNEQIEENMAAIKAALLAAKAAQDAADRALADANKAQGSADSANSNASAAHNRIGAIDDFEQKDALTVNFKVANWKLTDEMKAQLDAFAAKTAGLKGWIVEVSGFASSEGGNYYNHELSEKRAEAVMTYLVSVCNLPLRRVHAPYSAGELNPVADNGTKEGREQNRRVEIKILVSKGLASAEQSATPPTQN